MSSSYLYYIGEECPRDIYIEVGDDFCMNRCPYKDKIVVNERGLVTKLYCKYHHEKSCE